MNQPRDTDRDPHQGDLDEAVLRRATRAEAARVHAEPDWDDVLARAARRRRAGSPLVRLPVVAAAAVLVLLMVAVLVRSTTDDATDLTTDPAPSPVEDPTVPPTTDRVTDPSEGAVSHELEPNGRDVAPIDLPAGAPLAEGEVLGLIVTEVSEDGFTIFDLVVLDGRDGSTVRTLSAGHDSVEGGVFAISLSADRRTVLFSVATSACGTDVHAVAADGSSPDVVLFEANLAVLSPDGRFLAVDPRTSCVPLNQIELVPIEGGRTTVFGAGGHPLAGVDALADGQGGLGELAFEDDDSFVYEVADGVDDTLYRLDLTSGENPVIASGGEDGTTFSSLHTRGDGTVGVLMSCCGRGATVGPDEGGRSGFRFTVLDEGAVVEERTIDAADVTSAFLDPLLGLVFAQATGDQRDGVLTVDGIAVRRGVFVVAG